MLRCGTLDLPVSTDAAAQVGIRPEHVGVCGAGEGVGDAEVRVVELLGSETLVYLDAGGVALVARLPGMVEARVGERVGVRVDARRLHRFDAAGTRLT